MPRETGLYYLQSRYYNPEWGRFINADDPAYLGAGETLVSYNLYAYCGNNPVMGYDPMGCWNWEDQAKLGFAILLTGLAIILAAPTGGSSLVVGSMVLSSAAVVTAGGTLALTGTVMVGSAAIANISESNGKPTSRNQMDRQVQTGKAPKEVDRVDGPHVNVNNSQNHIHFKDGTAMNQDGSISHEGNGIPNITKSILEWILKNGWGLPKF